MFHLSLPVQDFAQCLAFYRDCFDARVVMLDEKAANVYVFGGQLTLHDKPHSGMDAAQRREMHFGHVVAVDDWYAIRDRVRQSERPVLKQIEPDDAAHKRGKLVVVDPSGNLVEINSGYPIAGNC